MSGQFFLIHALPWPEGDIHFQLPVRHPQVKEGTMTKPQEFQDQTTIQHETAYQVDEQYPKGPQAGTGVLGAGRVVWTPRQGAMSADQAQAKAFADGIGVISIEAASLRQA